MGTSAFGATDGLLDTAGIVEGCLEGPISLDCAAAPPACVACMPATVRPPPC